MGERRGRSRSAGRRGKGGDDEGGGKSGWLYMFLQQPQFAADPWQPRWCVIDDGRLQCYRDERRADMTASIPLLVTQVSQRDVSGTPFSFALEPAEDAAGQVEEHLFYVENEDDLMAWMLALRGARRRTRRFSGHLRPARPLSMRSRTRGSSAAAPGARRGSHEAHRAAAAPIHGTLRLNGRRSPNKRVARISDASDDGTGTGALPSSLPLHTDAATAAAGVSSSSKTGTRQGSEGRRPRQGSEGRRPRQGSEGRRPRKGSEGRRQGSEGRRSRPDSQNKLAGERSRPGSGSRGRRPPGRGGDDGASGGRKSRQMSAGGSAAKRNKSARPSATEGVDPSSGAAMVSLLGRHVQQESSGAGTGAEGRRPTTAISNADMAGYLKRQGTNRLVSTWLRRYFLLKDRSLYIFKNEGATKPLAMIDVTVCIASATTGVSSGTEGEAGFEIVSGDRTYVLLAETDSVRAQWLDAIARAQARFNPSTEQRMARPAAPHKDGSDASIGTRIPEPLGDGVVRPPSLRVTPAGSRSSMQVSAEDTAAGATQGVSKAGWLLKQTHGALKQWQKRWFHVTNGFLYYYRAQLDAAPAGVVDLFLCSVRTVPVPNRQHTFALVTPDRTYYLAADSNQEMLQWMRALRDANSSAVQEVRKSVDVMKMADRNKVLSSRFSERRVSAMKSIDVPDLPPDDDEDDGHDDDDDDEVGGDGAAASRGAMPRDLSSLSLDPPDRDRGDDDGDDIGAEAAALDGAAGSVAEQRRKKRLSMNSANRLMPDSGQGIDGGQLAPKLTRMLGVSSDVEKEGYMHKQSNNFFRDWRRRWCVLRGGFFNYYGKITDAEPAGSVNVLFAFAKPAPTTIGRKSCMELVTMGRSFFFAAENDRDMFDWIDKIQACNKRLMEEHLLDSDKNGRVSQDAPRDEEAEEVRMRRRVRAVAERTENRVCADCTARDPRWASANLGVFICIECCGVHRAMGVQVSFVRSVFLDNWTEEQVARMERVGNVAANGYWEGAMPEGEEKPNEDNGYADRDAFIRAKYVEQIFVDPDASPYNETDEIPVASMPDPLA